jgi:hypothetical protein
MWRATRTSIPMVETDRINLAALARFPSHAIPCLTVLHHPTWPNTYQAPVCQ